MTWILSAKIKRDEKFDTQNGMACRLFFRSRRFQSWGYYRVGIQRRDRRELTDIKAFVIYSNMRRISICKKKMPAESNPEIDFLER